MWTIHHLNRKVWNAVAAGLQTLSLQFINVWRTASAS